MEIIGFLAGIVSLVGFIPQTIKAIKTRRTKDISLSSFIMIGASALLWIIYGLYNNRPAIWATNTIVAICCFIVAGIKISNIKN
jgi:MtN3 and saliva related transmembrane protein